jgi:hypothetical protein
VQYVYLCKIVHCWLRPAMRAVVVAALVLCSSALPGARNPGADAAHLQRDLEAAIARDDFAGADDLKQKLKELRHQEKWKNASPADVEAAGLTLDAATQHAIDDKWAAAPFVDPFRLAREAAIRLAREAKAKRAALVPERAPSPDVDYRRFNTSRQDLDDLYLGCTLPRPFSGDSAREACAAIGMKRTGNRLASGEPAVELLDRWPERNMTNKKRSAVCIVGQMRSFPVSFIGWQTHLFPLMRTDDTDIDLFVITSNSGSLNYSAGILNSLPLAGKVVLNRESFLDRPNEVWSWRDRETAEASPLNGTMLSELQFNTAKFPKGDDKKDSYFIQHWQVAKCKEMLLEQEAKFKFTYRRVARMRTDVALAPMRGNRNHGVAGFTHHCNTTERCTRDMDEYHREHVLACQGSISSLEARRKSWTLKPTFDRGIVGSRDAVLQGFSGLTAMSTSTAFEGSWNLERFMGRARRKEMHPEHCNYWMYLLRLGRLKHIAKHQKDQTHRWAMKIQSGGWNELTGSDRSACNRSAPGREKHLAGIQQLAITRLAILPGMLDTFKCMEMGNCLAYQDDNCKKFYGEMHFKLNATGDTSLPTSGMSDFGDGRTDFG